jgi:antitoxin PrlF
MWETLPKIMGNKKYTLTWARIGNASGFCLSTSFFKDNPQFKAAKGAVEVISPHTLLVRLQPQSWLTNKSCTPSP